MRASWACRRQVKREYLFLYVSPDNVPTRCKKCAKAAEFACWQYEGSCKTPVAQSLQNGGYTVAIRWLYGGYTVQPILMPEWLVSPACVVTGLSLLAYMRVEFTVLVTNNITQNEIDHFLRNVDREISDPFEMTRRTEAVDGGGDVIRVFPHHLM